MALPSRLHCLLDLCLPGLPLWDLCCDHGHLGLYALNSSSYPEVIFNDIVPHVLADLPAQFAGRPGRVICSPAEDIGEPLTGNVVIAGVGGEKIFKILLAHATRSTLRAKRIAVCPEKDAPWLMAQEIPGYQIISRREIPHNRGTRWIVAYNPSEQVP
jgi:tRNA A22 N-methylase